VGIKINNCKSAVRVWDVEMFQDGRKTFVIHTIMYLVDNSFVRADRKIVK
jgi:hypothetical protein